MIRIQKRRAKEFTLDMAPMINVVFLLLIFFMLTSTAMTQGDEVELPESHSAESVQKRTLEVKIHPDGALFLEGRRVDLDGLPGELEARVKGKAGIILEIQADKNAEFEVFGTVLRAGQVAGIQDYILAAQAPRPH